MCTGLRARLAELRPVEVVCERGGLSDLTRKVLRAGLRSPRMTELPQFWDAGRTLAEVDKAGYYKEQKGAGEMTGPRVWPCVMLSTHCFAISSNADAQVFAKT